MNHLHVVAAVIIYNQQILCMQRGPSKYDYISYKYEFPGGKIEEGETGPEALMRELQEEMNITVANEGTAPAVCAKIKTQTEGLSPCLRGLREEINMKIKISEEDYFMTINHTYPDFELTMHTYICYAASPGFVRREHVDHKWLDPQALHTLDWAAADLPIVEKLMELKRC